MAPDSPKEPLDYRDREGALAAMEGMFRPQTRRLDPSSVNEPSRSPYSVVTSNNTNSDNDYSAFEKWLGYEVEKQRQLRIDNYNRNIRAVEEFRRAMQATYDNRIRIKNNAPPWRPPEDAILQQQLERAIQRQKRQILVLVEMVAELLRKQAGGSDLLVNNIVRVALGQEADEWGASLFDYEPDWPISIASGAMDRVKVLYAAVLRANVSNPNIDEALWLEEKQEKPKPEQDINPKRSFTFEEDETNEDPES